MPRNHCNAPPPIIHEVLLFPCRRRHRMLGIPATHDAFDLSTGTCHVTRVRHGVRYDTGESILIAGTSGPVDEDGYNITKLYWSREAGWFLLIVDWWEQMGFADDRFIHPLPPGEVLGVASRMIAPDDCLAFLGGFYFEGWIPRDDVVARRWAEAALSGDDLMFVRAQLDALQTIA